MLDRYKKILLGIPGVVGHPTAILALFAYGIAWFVVEKYNIGWDGFAQLITFVIVIGIQSSQNRDTKALHAKLDELIISLEEADSRFAGIEKKAEEDIEALSHSTPSDRKPS